MSVKRKMTDTLENPTKIRKLKDGTSASELKDFFLEYNIISHFLKEKNYLKSAAIQLYVC